jgi:hypothetical protein
VSEDTSPLPLIPPPFVLSQLTRTSSIEREAMWLSFECPPEASFVIRPYIGGVNGISGESMVGDMNSLIRRMNLSAQKQDYVVLPKQKWLDGIATRPGIVKQFVATPMVPPSEQLGTPRTDPQLEEQPEQPQGSQPQSSQPAEKSTVIGASLEWQMTGKDTVGGVQLQIIPKHNVGQMFFGSLQDAIKTRKYWESYVSPRHKRWNPEKLGLKNGDKIHVKNMMEHQTSREKLVKDLPSESPIPLKFNDVWNIEMCYDPSLERILKVDRADCSKPSVLLKVRTTPTKAFFCSQ